MPVSPSTALAPSSWLHDHHISFWVSESLKTRTRSSLGQQPRQEVRGAGPVSPALTCQVPWHCPFFFSGSPFAHLLQ